jgi:hypothetical protein
MTEILASASTLPVRDTEVRENVARLKSRLRRNDEAMRWLLSQGLRGATVDRLHLGLKEPYSPRDGSGTVEDPLCVPLLDEAMRPQSRYAYLRVPDVTPGGPELSAWGPGQCATYRLGTGAAGATAVVAAGLVDCWLAWQETRTAAAHDLVFLARSHSAGVPAEWRTPQFWDGFAAVVVLPGEGALELLRLISGYSATPVRALTLPPPHAAMVGIVGSVVDLAGLLASAPEWVPDVVSRPEATPAEATGRFASQPVDITGAYVDGFSYYPFAVETRGLEEVLSGGRLVQSYETLVLRSDGRLLEVRSLPAPRGTEARDRVVALSDGTRITAPPMTGQRSTWTFDGIERYIAWKRGSDRPFRALPCILADVERFLRSRVRLPHECHHLLAACYVALSHVFQVFDAVPLLLVTGPSSSGKSELAEAMARLGFNASMAGQLRAAGMIRLIDETRGLLVLDDVDGTGQASISGSGELAQTLKMAYKRSTARKPLADRTGRVRIADFYGPKVLTNVRGADQVLGSRLLVVRTSPDAPAVPGDGAEWTETVLDGLRDELHAWGLSEARGVSDAYRSDGGSFRDRRQEIVAPLLAMAQYAGDEDFTWRMASTFANPATFWAPEVPK